MAVEIVGSLMDGFKCEHAITLISSVFACCSVKVCRILGNFGTCAEYGI